MKVAALGGGNGLATVLRGFAAWARSGHPMNLTAIVTTADDGGSSGRLRVQRGGLPPGDLRNCLLALAPPADPWVRLFHHRYGGTGDLGGHAVGNLILTALAEQEGCYLKALELACRMLRTCGKVLPVTLEQVHLEGEVVCGHRIRGESRIGRSRERMRRVWLDPDDVRPTRGVEKAIREADLVVIGPGSLFTSVLAVLMVRGVAAAVRASKGRRILVGNLMTQPGETLDMSLDQHLQVLDEHVGPGLVQGVLVHHDRVDPSRLGAYTREGSRPIASKMKTRRPERLTARDLVTGSGKIRHKPTRLAEELLKLAGSRVIATARSHDRVRVPAAASFNLAAAGNVSNPKAGAGQ